MLIWIAPIFVLVRVVLKLANVLLIAPLFEEVVFRGFALQLLEDHGLAFRAANLITSLMFVGLHLPG